MQPTTQHRDFRPYTKSGVFKSKLSPAQIKLLERAGHGGVISGVNWLSMRSMADKGAVEVVEREVRQGPRGPINGKILAVRVK
jgi:hypothetical protein